jgi:hypothetical protein
LVLGQGGPFSADIVAKVFLGWRTKILRAADALYARQREGPYRFIQNRSRTSAVALKSDAAAENSKRSTFARFSGSLDFRLLQQYLPEADLNEGMNLVTVSFTFHACCIS